MIDHTFTKILAPKNDYRSVDRSISNDEFWHSFRRTILPLTPSQYDVTSICNLTCEGCLFFSGSDYLGHVDQNDLSVLDNFFASEAKRGVRFGYFAGAEPSLVEDKLLVAATHIPYGVVFSNGTKKLSSEIPYKIHVSVWGKPDLSKALRGADMLTKQIRNYRGDKRAVFVFTITAQNLDDIEWIASFCMENDVALTFNHYSPTSKYISYLSGESSEDVYHYRQNESGDLQLSEYHLSRSREIIDDLIDRGDGRILYNRNFNHMIHDVLGVNPDVDVETGVAIDCGTVLTSNLRHYNTDLTASSGKCCSPNIDCKTCRLYAQSFSTLLVRANRKMRDPIEKQRAISLWRLWSAIFLNDDRFSDWRPEEGTVQERLS